MLGALLAAVICSGAVFAEASGEQTDIVVNGVALSADTVCALQQVYPVAIAPGHSMSKTYCDNNGNCTSRGVLGYISTTAR